eukprot:2096171-Rhodomonas_salina.1
MQGKLNIEKKDEIKLSAVVQSVWERLNQKRAVKPGVDLVNRVRVASRFHPPRPPFSQDALCQQSVECSAAFSGQLRFQGSFVSRMDCAGSAECVLRVLSWRLGQCTCYAEPGTELGYGAMQVPDGLPVVQANSAICLRICDVVSGTDLAYDATRATECASH